MARSSTTFGRGNRFGAKPGDRLALRHGAYSPAVLEARFPELEARLERELATNPLPSQEVDSAQKRRWVFLTAQVESIQDFYRDNGGFYTRRGVPKKGVVLLTTLYKSLNDLERSMGIGQLARAQVIQAASAGRRDMAEVEGRYARMRAKQQAALAS